MSSQQPFLYRPETYDDARFPPNTFNPKAVTQSTYAPKMARPKQHGPLISLNSTTSAQTAMTNRAPPKPMSRRTKEWVKAMRKVQLFLRILELNGAIGLLVLMILITSTDPLIAWIMRIAPGVVVIHCIYGIYHLSRAAGRRPPTSSSAYHLFSGFSDLAVLPLYTFGTLAVKNNGSTWTTLLPNPDILEVLIPAVNYTLISAGGLHFISLIIALWLGFMFRRISQLPPDMNPLESHLTARARHKRNKSSVAVSSIGDNEKRLSMPLESRRRSGDPYESTSLSRPPTLPAVHTRSNSHDSKRDSRVDLPSRQYQIAPGNSPRNSPRSSQIEQPNDLKRMSVPILASRLTPRGSYFELPVHDQYTATSRSGTPASSGRLSTAPTAVHPTVSAESPRVGKFTEAWYTSDSLINRTQQRNRAMNSAAAQSPGGAEDRKRRTYEALNQRYDFSVDEDDEEQPAAYVYDSDDTGDNPNIRADRDAVSAMSSDDENENENHYAERDLTAASANRRNTYHPNPLRSNPLATASLPPPPRRQTPFRASDVSALSELSDVSINERSVSGSRDRDVATAAEREKKHMSAPPPATATTSPSKLTRKPTTWGRRGGASVAALAANTSGNNSNGGSGLGISSAPTSRTGVGKNRVGSIQAESAFYSKPYGELKAATPPIMVGPAAASTTTTATRVPTITAVPGSDSGSPRVVSSGNDFDDVDLRSRVYGRRNVSGKVAEEGRATRGYSRYGVLND